MFKRWRGQDSCLHFVLHCSLRQAHMQYSRHPAAGCPVACVAPMADMGQVRLWAYRVYPGWYRAHCGFFVLRLVPCIVPKMREGLCSPCASTVMLWGHLTSGDGQWPGDLLAPAVCCDGLQGPGTGQCLWDTVPCGEGMWHPLVPKLGMARTGTVVNEPPFSLWRRMSC